MGRSVVYDASANRDVASGQVLPTAIRQTVTLLFDHALPAGSYSIAVAAAVQAAPFNADEAALLTGGTAASEHPVASVVNGQIVAGSRIEATDLVLQSGALGDLRSVQAGNAFLTNLHDDLAAFLDQELTLKGDDPSVTPGLIDQVLRRFDPSLGSAGQRDTTAIVLILDPVSIEVDDPAGGMTTYNLLDDTLVQENPFVYVNVGGNIEILVILSSPTTTSPIVLTVNNAQPTSRGAAVVLGPSGNQMIPLTGPIRSGQQSFVIPRG